MVKLRKRSQINTLALTVANPILSFIIHNSTDFLNEQWTIYSTITTSIERTNKFIKIKSTRLDKNL